MTVKLDRFWRRPKQTPKEMGEELRTRTWKVHTMLQAGKMKETTDELIKWDMHIAPLQETRWNGIGRLDKEEYTLLYSGQPEK